MTTLIGNRSRLPRNQDPIDRFTKVFNVCADLWFNPNFDKITQDDISDAEARKILNDYLRKNEWKIKALPRIFPFDSYGTRNGTREWAIFEYKQCNRTLSQCVQCETTGGLFVSDKKLKFMHTAELTGFDKAILLYFVRHETIPNNYDLYWFTRKNINISKLPKEVYLNEDGYVLNPGLVRHYKKATYDMISKRWI